jgi:hypothetical protein
MTTTLGRKGGFDSFTFPAFGAKPQISMEQTIDIYGANSFLLISYNFSLNDKADSHITGNETFCGGTFDAQLKKIIY